MPAYFAQIFNIYIEKGSALGWCQSFRGAKFLKLDPDFDVYTDKNYGIYRRTNSCDNFFYFIILGTRL